MIIKVKRAAVQKLKTPCLVLGVWESKSKSGLLQELDAELGGRIGRALREGEFTGKSLQTLLVDGTDSVRFQRLLLVGLGKDRQAGGELLRQAAATAARLLQEKKITSFVCALHQAELKKLGFEERVRAVVEGIFLARYRYDRYVTKNRDNLPGAFSEVILALEVGPALEFVEAAVEQGRAVAEAVCFARDLVNAPGNLKSPAYLADQAALAAGEFGLACRILERPELEEKGFGGLLGVAQGSSRAPRLIVLEHRGGDEGEPPVVLVGKGVVFDAGGISLKPAEKMDEMKMDMAGGAAVMGTLVAAARLKLPVNLVGIVPAVENLPSGTAYRPGDILTSLSGQTIEVLNTDAEGRLILADALCFARQYNPRLVVDLATLTGACIIALGHHASAVLGNDEALIKKLIAAGERSGERLWQLPLWDEYSQQIKSDVADVKNVGGRPAGTITAAAFLKEFAEGLCWAHLDIAGTAWEEKGKAWAPKGGTGVGVRLLVDFLSN